MNEFTKPIVVVSKCLEFEECRYNGDMIPDATIRNLTPFVTFMPVCPEVEIGLGIPREVIRIIKENEEKKLVQPTTNKDLSEDMRNFSQNYLEHLHEVDGFILKTRSPSCGVRDVKVYSGVEKGSNTVEKSSGFFAEEVLKKFPNKAIEEEGRLKNFTIREHFLTKLFALSKFRKLKQDHTISELMDYHAMNKYLFMSYNQLRLKELGKILGKQKDYSSTEVFNLYEEQLSKLFAKAPRYTSNINVCQHIFGYFSQQLKENERHYFIELLEKYREKKIPLSSIISILKGWVIRFNNEYLFKQTFFNPYPEELVEISDSGKGRDYR